MDGRALGSARLTILLLLLAVGVGLAWLLLGGREDVANGRSLSRSSDESTAPSLRLAGRPARQPSATSSTTKDEGGADGAPSTKGQAKEVQAIGVDVKDRNGRPLAEARVTVRIAREGGGKPLQVRGQTDHAGHIGLSLPEGRIVAVKIEAKLLRGYATVLDREDPAGVDFADLNEVLADELVFLPVRTVDDQGVPRPGERVLYRTRTEEEEPTGWWGSTSDAEGWCHLGPFVMRTLVEVRAGPRGLERDRIDDPTAWTQTRVDGTVLELVVEDVPKLRLAFPGLAEDVVVPINVLDAQTGHRLFPVQSHPVSSGIWDAPAIDAARRLELVVGPLEDGRFRRLENAFPTVAPIAVRLERGVALTGRVVVGAGETPRPARVVAHGRGFHMIASMEEEGRFRFTGVPDEPLTLVASHLVSRDRPRELGGWVERRLGQSHVEIPWRRLARIQARVAYPSGAPAVPSRDWIRAEATSPDLPSRSVAQIDAEGAFELGLHAGTWTIEVRCRTVAGENLTATLDLDVAYDERREVVLTLQPRGE